MSTIAGFGAPARRPEHSSVNDHTEAPLEVGSLRQRQRDRQRDPVTRRTAGLLVLGPLLHDGRVRVLAPDRRGCVLRYAGRVSSVSVDDDAIDAKLATGTDGAWAYTAGLNWYLNKNFEFQFNYERTDFDNEVTFSGKQRHHEDVLLTRFQLAF